MEKEFAIVIKNKLTNNVKVQNGPKIACKNKLSIGSGIFAQAGLETIEAMIAKYIAMPNGTKTGQDIFNMFSWALASRSFNSKYEVLLLEISSKEEYNKLIKDYIR